MNVEMISAWLIRLSGPVFFFCFTILVQTAIIIMLGLFCSHMIRNRGAAFQSTVLRTALILVLVSPPGVLISRHFHSVGIVVDVTPVVESTLAAEQPLSAVDRRSGNMYRSEIPSTVHDNSGESTVHSTVIAGGDQDEIAELSHEGCNSGWLSGFLKYGMFAIPLFFAVLWVGFSLFRAVQLGIAYVRLRELLNFSHLASRPVLEMSDRIAARLDVMPPLVMVNSLISSPFISGLFQPVLYIPAKDTESVISRHEILIHELAHVKRKDILWNFLFSFASIILPVQPLLALLGRELEKNSEFVCDDYVLHYQINRKQYATTLLDMAESMHEQMRGSIFQYNASLVSSPLEQRIKRIIDKSRQIATVTDWKTKLLIWISTPCMTLMVMFCSFEAGGTIRDTGSSVQPADTMFVLSQKPLFDRIDVLEKRIRAARSSIDTIPFLDSLPVLSHRTLNEQMTSINAMNVSGFEDQEHITESAIDFDMDVDDLYSHVVIEQADDSTTYHDARHPAKMVFAGRTARNVSDETILPTTLEIRFVTNQTEIGNATKLKPSIKSYYNVISPAELLEGKTNIDTSMGQMSANAVFEINKPGKSVKIKIDAQANYFEDLGSGIYPAPGSVKNKWKWNQNIDIPIEPNRKNVVEIMVKMSKEIDINRIEKTKENRKSKAKKEPYDFKELDSSLFNSNPLLLTENARKEDAAKITILEIQLVTDQTKSGPGTSMGPAIKADYAMLLPARQIKGVTRIDTEKKQMSARAVYEILDPENKVQIKIHASSHYNGNLRRFNMPKKWSHSKDFDISVIPNKKNLVQIIVKMSGDIEIKNIGK